MIPCGMRSVLMSSNVGSNNVILCNILPIRDVAQIDIPTYVWGSFIDSL